MPFTRFSGEEKIMLSSALIVMGEGSFWLSAIILGREAVERFRAFNWRARLSGMLKNIKKKITNK